MIKGNCMSENVTVATESNLKCPGKLLVHCSLKGRLVTTVAHFCAM